MFLHRGERGPKGQATAAIKLLKASLPFCCAIATLALAACGESPGASNDAIPESEPTFELTMGTGQDAFEPLDEGGVLVLERGSQGLQHVYVSLRAPIAEGLHLIDLSVTFNGRVFSSPTRVNAPFISVPGEEFAELVGQFVVIPEPGGVLNVPATLRARVEPSAGGFGEVVREVRIRW